MGSRAPNTTKHCEPRVRRRRLRMQPSRAPGPWVGCQPTTSSRSLALPAAALPAPFSYTHRLVRSCPHAPAGSGADSPIPQNSFVWDSARNGLASPRTHTAPGRGPAALPDSQRASPPADLPYTAPPREALPYYDHPITYLALREPGSTERQGLLHTYQGRPAALPVLVHYGVRTSDFWAPFPSGL